MAVVRSRSFRGVGTLDGSSACPGHHLGDLILWHFRRLLPRRCRVRVTLHWVLIHTGMGNGAVNVQVKLPARGRLIGDSNSSSCRAASQVFPWSVSAVGQYTLQTLRKEAVLTSTPQRSRTRQMSPSLPTKIYIKPACYIGVSPFSRNSVLVSLPADLHVKSICPTASSPQPAGYTTSRICPFLKKGSDKGVPVGQSPPLQPVIPGAL